MILTIFDWIINFISGVPKMWFYDWFICIIQPKISNNSANILKSVNRKNELIIWEKIFIHKHAHHIMNFEVPPKCSFIKKYVCRTPDSAGINQQCHNTTLQSIWFKNEQNITQNNCLQGKQIALVWDYW